ncbi:hypothetical protein [Bartonella sp. CB175]|uniref:hypothetical protein n=1 Tax=Bartonella sp. CB175 TaxID=3112256 RepID=UPI00300E4D48
MPSYLKTHYYRVPLYYAGRDKNIIKLEPQKYDAVLFISEKAAQSVAKKLAKDYLRDDFFVVQQPC